MAIPTSGYPTTLDDTNATPGATVEFPQPSSSTDLDATNVEHDLLHTNGSLAIVALQTKLGITASTRTYAGGGGGGAGSGSTGGTGGSSIGGAGVIVGQAVGGVPNTGSGGGGALGGGASATNPSGTGSSGIVLIRYVVAA